MLLHIKKGIAYTMPYTFRTSSEENTDKSSENAEISDLVELH